MQRKPVILLVDDDRDFIDSTRTVLQSKPYEIIVAENGQEGVRIAREKKPDLIILDVIMPVEDGFTAAEHIKKDDKLKNIPVLMLTSFAQRVGETSIPMSRGMDLDTEDYIEKPVDPKVLLETVSRHLKKLGF